MDFNELTNEQIRKRWEEDAAFDPEVRDMQWHEIGGVLLNRIEELKEKLGEEA